MHLRPSALIASLALASSYALAAAHTSAAPATFPPASSEGSLLAPSNLASAVRARLLVSRFDTGVAQWSLLDAGGREVSLSLTIDGRLSTIHLTAAPLRAEGFQALAQIHDGSVVSITAPKPATYRGTLDSDPSASVAVSLLPEGLLGAIIDADGSMLMLHPARLLDPAAPSDLVIAYRPEDRIVPGSALQCGTPDDPFRDAEGAGHDDPLIQSSGSTGDSPADASCTRLSQIGYDADYEYYLAMGSSTDAVISSIEASTNVMNAVFARDVMIVHEITAIIVRTDDNDPYSSSSSGTRLTQLGQEWTTNQAGIPRDTAHLISGYLWFDDWIIGLAWVGVVCDFNYGYALSNMAWADVMTHEMGHNWAAPHCLDPAPCNSMCGGCLNFGEITTDVILAHRNSRWCLDEIEYLIPTPPRARTDSAATLNTDAVRVDVLANDFDGNCQTFDISAFDAVTAGGGTVTLSEGTGPDGRDELLYTPGSSFAGNDLINYTIMDSEGLTGPGIVNINVQSLRTPDQPPYTLPGARVSYYELSAPSALPDFDTLTPYATVEVPEINFPSSVNEFATSGRSDNVGAVFRGLVTVPQDGLYWLSTESDDGSRLFVGDVMVVNNDGLHGMVERAGAVGLKAGSHAVRVEFFEGGGGAGLVTRIEGPGMSKQVIPAHAWSHELTPNLRIDPLRQNERCSIVCQDAPPGETVYFLYSLRGSEPTFIPQLNVTVDLTNPKLAGSDETNAWGVATIRITPPNGSRNTVIWIQAAMRNETSDMVLTQIN